MSRWIAWWHLVMLDHAQGWSHRFAQHSEQPLYYDLVRCECGKVWHLV